MTRNGFPRPPLGVGGRSARSHFSFIHSTACAAGGLLQRGGPYAVGKHKGTGSLEIQVGSRGVGY